MTETPEEGFDLAVSMARRAVKMTQPDVETLHKLRSTHDPDSPHRRIGVVAAYFQMIAEANDSWRK
jgi:hypothetical protein